MRYRIVDVFTHRPLSGNALCVVLDPWAAGIKKRGRQAGLFLNE
jgi:predicted PhzF superfamily epimerase YddE/YHI9